MDTKSAWITAAATVLAAAIAGAAVVTAAESKNRIPVASLRIAALAGPAPHSTVADASGSYDADGEVLTYSWFLDGQRLPETTSIVSLTLRSPGRYEVLVQVSDGQAKAVGKRFIDVK